MGLSARQTHLGVMPFPRPAFPPIEFRTNGSLGVLPQPLGVALGVMPLLIGSRPSLKTGGAFLSRLGVGFRVQGLGIRG
jgi:hypothetical protein